MKIILVPVLIGAALALAGCPAKEDQPPKPKVTAGAPPATTPSGMAKAGPGEAAIARSSGAALPTMGPAPSWKLPDVNGAMVTSDLFKGKVVIVDFWATWCPPCVKEVPEYVELARKYRNDGLVIVGASIDDGGPEVVKKFAARNGVNYPLVMASEEVVAAFGGIEAVPTAFLIDRQGQIRDRKIGLVDMAEYEKKIVSLLR